MHTLGDAHVYLNHIEPLNIQVSMIKFYNTNLNDVIMKMLLHSSLSLHESHTPFPPLSSSEVTKLKTLMILSLKIFVSMATPLTQRSKWIWLSEYLTVLLVFQNSL